MGSIKLSIRGDKSIAYNITNYIFLLYNYLIFKQMWCFSMNL